MSTPVMSMPVALSVSVGAAIGILGVFAAAQPASAQVVGTAAAVNQNASGGGQTLAIGAQVIHNEHIQTNASGSLQLLFVDRTSLAVGPGSDIVIDDYVFDTQKNTGKMTVSVGKGLMRFIGGQITHNGEATVKTPSATIGIRGGTVQVSVGAQVGTQGGGGTSANATQVIFLGGNTPRAGATVTPTVTTGTGGTGTGAGGTGGATTGGSVNLTVPGNGTTVQSTSTTGGAPVASSPAPVAASTIAAQNVQLTSSPAAGQTGGAPAAVVTQAVTLSATVPAAASTTITTTTAATSPAASGPGTGGTATTTSGTSASTDQTIGTTTQSTQQSSQQAANAATIQQSFGRAAFALSISSGSAAPPFIAPQFVNTGANTANSFISNVLGYRLQSTAESPGTPARGAFLQYGLSIAGSGATQTSGIYLATGAFIDDGNGGILTQGGFSGTRRNGGNQAVNFDSGPLSSPAGTTSVDENRLPLSTTVNQIYYNTQTQQYQPDDITEHKTQYNIGSGNTLYTYDASMSRIATPAGLGDLRQPFGTSTTTLSGYAAGIMRTRDTTNGLNIPTTGGFIVGNTNNSNGDITVQLDSATSRIQASFNVVRQSGTTVTGILSNAYYQFGSLDPNQASRGTFIDYDNFGARGAEVRTNIQTGASDPVSTANGGAYSSTTGVFVAIQPAVAQQIFSSNGNTTSFCQCTYTRWGFWSMDGTRSGTPSYTDLGNMMLWVAGVPSTGAEVAAMTGSATYNGHLIGNVNTAGGNNYIAAANFQNTVNFGTRTGAMVVGTGAGSAMLDGTNYTGSVSYPAGSANFAGTLTGTTAGRNMAITGNFFRGASSPAGEMGGSYRVIGTGGQAGYLQTGIFAGKM